MRSLVILVIAAVAAFSTAADARIVIAVDKSAQRMTVTVDGAPRWTWAVSTGRRGHATPNGKHQAFRLEKDHFSKEWDDAPMPHSIFFTKRGHAIHGSYDIKRLGTAASAGCIRLHPDNAKRLFELVQQRGVMTATVIITGEEPRRQAPAVARGAPQAIPPAQQMPQVQRAQRQQPAVAEYDDLPPYQEYRGRGYGAPVYQDQRGGYYEPRGGYYDPPPPPRGYRYAPGPY